MTAGTGGPVGLPPGFGESLIDHGTTEFDTLTHAEALAVAASNLAVEEYAMARYAARDGADLLYAQSICSKLQSGYPAAVVNEAIASATWLANNDATYRAIVRRVRARGRRYQINSPEGDRP
jgi:predicted DNA-binding transcriptional regulator YafY